MVGVVPHGGRGKGATSPPQDPPPGVGSGALSSAFRVARTAPKGVQHRQGTGTRRRETPNRCLNRRHRCRRSVGGTPGPVLGSRARDRAHWQRRQPPGTVQAPLVAPSCQNHAAGLQDRIYDEAGASVAGCHRSPVAVGTRQVWGSW